MSNPTTDIKKVELTKEDEKINDVVKDEEQYFSITPFVLTGLATMVITLILTFSAFQYWQNNYQQRILTVKMSDVLANHILEIGASRLNEQQKSEYALKWSMALDETIKELTEDNRTIVLTQNTSIAGVEDFTDFVEVSAKRKVGGINGYAEKTQKQ